MTERDRKQSVESESCILAGVILPRQEIEPVLLDELQGLAESAGASVVAKLVQRREKPVGATYLGSGKVNELVQLVKDRNADVVISGVNAFVVAQNGKKYLYSRRGTWSIGTLRPMPPAGTPSPPPSSSRPTGSALKTQSIEIL